MPAAVTAAAMSATATHHRRGGEQTQHQSDIHDRREFHAHRQQEQHCNSTGSNQLNRQNTINICGSIKDSCQANRHHEQHKSSRSEQKISDRHDRIP
jgi:hypothetical protein